MKLIVKVPYKSTNVYQSVKQHEIVIEIFQTCVGTDITEFNFYVFNYVLVVYLALTSYM